MTSITGEFGKYQKIWCCLTALTSVTTSLLIYSNKFLTTKVDFWCQPPSHLNLTIDQWINISAPIKEDEFDKCSIFNITYTDSTTRPANDTPTMKCNAWDYDTTHYKVFHTFLPFFPLFMYLILEYCEGEMGFSV